MSRDDALLQQLIQRVWRLERDLAAIKDRLGVVSEPEPEPAAPAPAPPVQPSVAAAVPVRVTRPAEVATVAAAPPSDKAEVDFVGTWFARVGVIAILIGAGFAFKYAIDRGILGPGARVAVGMLAGVGFIGWSESAVRRGWNTFSQAIAAGGVALLYLSILAAQHLYNLVGTGPAFVGLLVVTAAAAGLAMRHESLALAVLTVVAAFLNPFVTEAAEDSGTFLIAYTLAVDVVIVALGHLRWRTLDRLAYVGTMLVMLAVVSDASFVVSLLACAVLVLGVFGSVPFVRAARMREAGQHSADLVLLSGFGFLGLGLGLVMDHHESWAGVFVLACAVVFGLGALAALRMQLQWEAIAHAGLAVSCLILFPPVQLEGSVLPAAWALEGLLVAVLTQRVVMQKGRWLADALLAVASLSLIGTLADAYPLPRLIATSDGLSAVIVIGCVAVAAVITRADELLSTARAVGANLIALVWLSIEVTSAVSGAEEVGQASSFALSGLWSVYAAAALVIGMVVSIRWARLFGLGLFGIVVAKLAVSDLWSLQTSYRIIAFIGLGALLLACSVLYQKFRDVVLGPDEDG